MQLMLMLMLTRMTGMKMKMTKTDAWIEAGRPSQASELIAMTTWKPSYQVSNAGRQAFAKITMTLPRLLLLLLLMLMTTKNMKTTTEQLW